MISFHNINSIAKYETKTLLRSWFFRIYAILAMAVLFFFNFGILTQAGGGAGEWSIKALPSVLPYANLILLNVTQAIIAIFLASDFLKRDKKLDTTEVIYMRSMTNGEYVVGKTIGTLLVFLVFNILVLSIALAFNLAVEGMAVSWISYLNYFLLICIPTLVFIMGLSFFIMSLLRNQAITFMLLLGYVALTLFYLQNKFYYVFDYMAFNVPMTYSDFVGFGNRETLLIHRGIYFLLGISFIFLTVTFLKRLPQAKYFRQITILLFAVFFAGGIYLAYLHVGKVTRQNDLRVEMVKINDSLANKKVSTVKSYQIELEHKNDIIEVKSKLKVRNEEAKPIQLIFTLNPGLKLSEVKLNGKETQFTRNIHIIELNDQLAENSSAEIEFSYSGTINEAACYLDIDDETRQTPRSQMMYKIDKRHSFISPEYVLLTRENNWYPIPGATYGNRNKQWFHRQFSNFKLQVKTKAELTAISQGNAKTDSTGITNFTNINKLSQISLVIGQYEKQSQNIDGLNFNLYIKDDHDYFSEFFEDIKDTIPSIITESLQDFERTIDMYYPFETFSLVEVPIQFYSYDHIYTGEREPIQPEMILYPEKGLTERDADFNGRVKRMQRFRRGDSANMTEEEQKISALQAFLSSFTETQGRPNFSRQNGNVQVTEQANAYYCFPMFYNQAYYISSENWPVTNRIFESYLKQATSDPRSGFMRNFQGTSEDEQANVALLEHSFAELLNDPEQITIIDNVIQLKGEALFSIIKRKTGEDAFDDFMYDFLYRNKFKTVDIKEFNREIKRRFNIDLLPYMEDWFNSKELPAYLIGSVDAVEVLDGDRLKTMVKFKITNAEPVEGIVSVQFMIGSGGRGFFGGGGSDMETITKLVHLEGNQTKRVSFLLDETPRRATIKTLTSKNIPAEINIPMDNVKEDSKAIPVEEEIIDDIPVRIAEENEVIVDDEDEAFSVIQTEDISLLQKLLLKEDEDKSKYAGFSTRRAPHNWTATTNSGFYGKFIRSAHYIRSGDGSKKAVWTIPVKESAYYEVYTYISKQSNRGPRRGRDRNDNNGEYEYNIHHDDGDEEALIDIKSAEDGWNHLGAFYFSKGEAKIELTNKSESRIVVADAIKIVKQ